MEKSWVPLMQKHFNPRSREGSDDKSRDVTRDRVYFNPRSREGSDQSYQYRFSTGAISIHAPARGATAKSLYRILKQ